MAEPWLQAVADDVAAAVLSGEATDKASVHRAKTSATRRHHAPRTPQDPELLVCLDPETAARCAPLLRKKPMRSQSGVAIVAVMSSPAACPHGKCIYCPGGPEVDAPQSYTGFEPSTMRAKRHGYDPYRIVGSRLAQLQRNGHPIDKIEVVVQGGTFPARDLAYQDGFIAGIYAACNAGPAETPIDWSDADDFEGRDDDGRRDALAQLMQQNEEAACRVIGLTVETKPDWCFEEHIDGMLRHGATRIELGIQTLDDDVTRLTNRGHTVDDGRRAMRAARDAGFKVCCHMMPGLPRPQGGASPAPAREAGWSDGLPRPTGGPGRYAVDPAADVADIRDLFEGPGAADWQPDMLKIYPTLIVEEGETTLKKWWREGRFEPLDTAGAVDVVAEALRYVPEWCRIQRIDRDIPTTHVLAGVQNSNLRQLAEAEAQRRGVALRDIRAREVGTRLREGRDVRPDRLEAVRRDYRASGGDEVFLSLEDPVADAVAGFIRIRRPGPRDDAHRAEFRHPDGVVVVRELKVYGAAQRIGEHDEAAWQHRGLGARLLAAAEEVAHGWGVGRILVIAGPGVKAYYRRHGYARLGPYMAKESA